MTHSEEAVTTEAVPQLITTDKRSDIIKMADEFKNHLKVSGKAHYIAADRRSRQYTALGLPVVVITSIVGTSIFATIEDNPEVGWKILVGIVSLLAAVLSAAQTFFRFSERAQEHKSAGAAYARLHREVQIFELKYPEGAGDRSAALRELARINDRIGDLAESSPQLDYRFREKVHKKDEEERKQEREKILKQKAALAE
jgi:hypothetical protein